MKITSWNVNSINARIEHLIAYIKSNKSQIKSNVESAYGVNVVHIRTLITKTAQKRNARTGSWMIGKKIKKALVKIQDGQTINIFEGV